VKNIHCKFDNCVTTVSHHPPTGRDWALEPIYSNGFALQKRLCGFGVS